MTNPDGRSLEAASFKRATAGQDVLDRIEGWDVWTCDGPEYRHDYDRPVTLYVRRGKAVVEFEDGGRADLQPGDTLTINQGARAVWKISEQIQNSYAYHDKP